MKKTITYGTFDVFHYGHLLLLERASHLGDWLVVAVSTDEFNEEKGKSAQFDYKTRAHMVSCLRFVDQVIPESNWAQKRDDIEALGIDTFVMGDDWEGKFDELTQHCDVVYLSRTPDISSTLIRSERQKTVSRFDATNRSL